jgi:hypothetical protein
MRVPFFSKPKDTASYRSPAGQMRAGEVIARFLLRLSRHRRVMRLAGRLQSRPLEPQA